MNTPNTTCAYCDKAIYKYPCYMRSGKPLYCNRVCMATGRHAKTDAILPRVQLLAQTMTLKKVAKKLGIGYTNLTSLAENWRKRGIVIGSKPPRKLKPRTRKTAGGYFKWGCAEDMLTGDVAA